MSADDFGAKSEEMELRANDRPYLVITVVSSVLLGAVLFLHVWKNIPVGHLTADPIALADELPVYSGFLSQVGILIWSAAASICFFCAKRLWHTRAERELKRFLVVSGAFTLWLALDDMFLLHETVFPLIGIPQNIVLGSYILLTLAYQFPAAGNVPVILRGVGYSGCVQTVQTLIDVLRGRREADRDRSVDRLLYRSWGIRNRLCFRRAA